jgi:hypothetical protein
MTTAISLCYPDVLKIEDIYIFGYTTSMCRSPTFLDPANQRRSMRKCVLFNRTATVYIQGR